MIHSVFCLSLGVVLKSEIVLVVTKVSTLNFLFEFREVNCKAFTLLFALVVFTVKLSLIKLLLPHFS